MGNTLFGEEFRNNVQLEDLWEKHVGERKSAAEVKLILGHSMLNNNLHPGILSAREIRDPGSSIQGSKPAHFSVDDFYESDWKEQQFPLRTRKGKEMDTVFITWCNMVKNASQSELQQIWSESFDDAPFPTTDWFPVDNEAWLRTVRNPEWLFRCALVQKMDNQRHYPVCLYRLSAKGPFKGRFDSSRFGSELKSDYEFYVEGETPAQVMARFALVVKEYQEPM